MGRLAWSQVRFRLARTLALVAGVLVAATAFTVLTAASQTAQARTVGKVSANFQPAYDILVRPKGARSAVESRTGTVAPDFLSGSLTGAGLGLAAAAWFAGQLPARLLAIAAVAVVAGVLITAVAALLPAALLRRLPTAHLLAEE